MKKYLLISCEFESVYLVNGVFSETLPPFEMDDGNEIYLTVLPLKAALLPYTVKIEGGVPKNNRELVSAYFLPRGFVEISLKPRFNYVHTPHGVALRNSRQDVSKNSALRCFWHIKKGEMQKARALLSEELNASMNDNDLLGFFSEYVDAIANQYYPEFAGSIILIDQNNRGNVFSVDFRNGLINNMEKVLGSE